MNKMSKTKDYMLNLEALAWDAIDYGCQTDEEIFAYMSDWVTVDFGTVEALTRQMCYGGFAVTEGLDIIESIAYH
jgi:hypothetical protein